MNGHYPIYIVSKGRADTSFTSHILHRMGVPHYVVVEAFERDAYSEALDGSATILVLDPAYQRDYDTCDDLGLSKSPGPGPARNFAWDHSISIGAASHWVMDDNILAFKRLVRNQEYHFADGTCFTMMEDFVDRYSNVAMAGPQYQGFTFRRAKLPPFVPNTRIYSCNLIRNDVPYRWRARYNEDTDLSLRMLKDGWVTIQFYAVMATKIATQTVRGGNTADFYAVEGTEPKTDMLVRLHPDVTRKVVRFGRVHHVVNYRPFAGNRLHRRPHLPVASGANEYGMRLEQRTPEGWVPLP
jgi:hypothetical protein